MILTSIGFHTFTIYQRLTVKEALELYKSFLSSNEIYLDESNLRTYENEFIQKLYLGLAKYYNFKYRKKYKGLSWTLRLNNKSSKFIDGTVVDEEKPCSIKATINPKLLCGIKDYVMAADVSYLNEVIENFNIEAKKASPILKDFNSYSLNRNDYCINFDLKELETNCTVEQMIKLIKQGNIPNHFVERTIYDEKKNTHRKTTDANCFYLENNSVTINCYCKHHQLEEEFKNCPNIKDSLNVIRFEVQCKYLKIYYLLERIKDITGFSNIMNEILSDDYSERIVNKYFYKVIRRGDYYTLDEAKQRIKYQHYNRNKEDRLIHTLELVNQSRGIWKAKTKLQGRELEIFKQSLKDLDILRINPVTIPRECNIKYIPNLMTAYYNKINEEQNQKRLEELNETILDDYIKDCRKKKKKKIIKFLMELNIISVAG